MKKGIIFMPLKTINKIKDIIQITNNIKDYCIKNKIFIIDIPAVGLFENGEFIHKKVREFYEQNKHIIEISNILGIIKLNLSEGDELFVNELQGVFKSKGILPNVLDPKSDDVLSKIAIFNNMEQKQEKLI